MFNYFIAQVKAKNLVTDIDDVEFEDWCVTNIHAHFCYCADVSKLPLLKMLLKMQSKNCQMLTYLTVCLIKFMTYENTSLLDLSHWKQSNPIF